MAVGRLTVGDILVKLQGGHHRKKKNREYTPRKTNMEPEKVTPGRRNSY